MDAGTGWRRLAGPLALSLAGHALLLALCLFVPKSGPDVRGASEERAEAPGPFTVHLVRHASTPPASEGVPLPGEGPWVPIPVQPALGTAAVPHEKNGADRPVIHGPGAPARASPGGQGVSGPPALLAVGPTARRIVFLIDSSVSMGPTGAFTRAREEVIASLRRLPPEAAFQVIAYSRTAAPLLGQPLELLPATAATIEQAVEALEQLAESGRTDHLLAVKSALTYRPDVLFLLTDADDLPPAAARELAWLRTGQTTVHVIVLAGDRAEEQGALAQLAQRTGGQYRRLPPAR